MDGRHGIWEQPIPAARTLWGGMQDLSELAYIFEFSTKHIVKDGHSYGNGIISPCGGCKTCHLSTRPCD